MTHKAVPVRLISTISQSSSRSLCEKLIHIGYQDIEILDCNESLQTDDRGNSIIIFPISREGQQRRGLPADLITFLKKMHHHPVLGVLQPPVDSQDYEALTYCNEFLYWPCTESEIDCRIERLAQLLQVSSREGSSDHICDEFLRLNMVGSSPVFVDVLHQIKKIAGCDAPVLIRGESGTGKELTARAIHYIGSRRDYPFIPVNCGAIPDSLLENELFGHKQGAFTDAKVSQDGLVCQAEGGTLFLDEVETFSPKGQVVLLRFLQDLQYKSLGSSQNKKANVRIIAASNANLEELVSQGEFRKDLYYRLNIMSVSMPPLCQRGDDVLELADYFLDKFRKQYDQSQKKFTHDLIQWMRNYSWPGNVRELENFLHREFLLTEGLFIRPAVKLMAQNERRSAGIDRRQESYLNYTMQDAKAKVIRDFEIEYLNLLLCKTNGNVTKASKIAGKERRALGKLIKKYNIDKNMNT